MIVLAGCSQSADMEGIWQYQSYTAEVVGTDQVETGVNAVRVPWLEVTTETMTGNAGCNDFVGPYQQSDEGFTSDLMKNAAWCGPEDGRLMEAEFAWESVVWQGSSVAVTVDDGRMVWSIGDDRLEFVSVESIPTTQPAPPPPMSEVGSLDCSPGLVNEVRVPDEGQAPLDIAREADPRVVEVVPGQPLWQSGVDAGGEVIVELALGDMPGADYQVWTCAD